MCGVLYLVRRSLTPEALRCIYFSLGYSHIIYGITIWGGAHACYLRPLIVAQKRLVRTICQANRMDPSLPLFNNLKLLKYDNVYLYFSLVFAHKCLHSNYISDVCNPVNHNHNSRFANTNVILPPVARRTVVDKSFLYSVPKCWNNLTVDLKREIRFEPFKSKLKIHLLNNQMS